jgi:hypothetical protein
VGTFLILLGVAAFAGTAGTLVYLRFRRADAKLERWASDHGYVILSRERRALRRGPFSLSDDEADVYRVVVRESSGRERTGHVRTGALGSDAVDVRWDN